MLGTVEFLKKTGLTRRQAEYWFGKGYLECAIPFPGSGADREIPQSEVATAKRIKRLLDVGLKLEIAAEVARSDEARRSFLKDLTEAFYGPN